MRTTETPIFDALAHEFEAQRPLIHVARALGGEALGDPSATTRASQVRHAPSSDSRRLPRRPRRNPGAC